MHRLGSYLPQGRLRAVLRGEDLSDYARGFAFFADISAFTPLTEKLTRALGARKGVETLSELLNAVNGAPIDRIEYYGGSIIAFAGDSILGWFEETELSITGLRALSYALDIEVAMQDFQSAWDAGPKMDVEPAFRFALVN